MQCTRPAHAQNRHPRPRAKQKHNDQATYPPARPTTHADTDRVLDARARTHTQVKPRLQDTGDPSPASIESVQVFPVVTSLGSQGARHAVTLDTQRTTIGVGTRRVQQFLRGDDHTGVVAPLHVHQR